MHESSRRTCVCAMEMDVLPILSWILNSQLECWNGRSRHNGELAIERLNYFKHAIQHEFAQSSR